MTTLVITEEDGRSYVSCKHSSPRTRLTARLRSWTLDSRLASGACPDSTAALSLRAHSLIGGSTRQRLANALRRLVREAQRPPDPFLRGVPICRDEILRARAGLEELADQLLDPMPVDARGVAMVRLLLADGSSPIYHRCRDGDLEQALQQALDALRLRLAVDV